MRSIPKRVLIHNATLNSTTSKDFWQNPTSDPISLNFVRFEPTDKLVNTSDNQEQQLVSIMFFDTRNSRPLNQEFNKNDTIVFNNKTYTVIQIDELYDGAKLHHLEIGLI